MEGLHTVKALIQQNDWMAKVDLKDAFFMVPIAQEHQHLLLFKIEMGTFHSKCLPFGLCTAPRVFTKVLKPAIELLRSVGIRLVIYMDDMLIMAHSTQRACVSSAVFARESWLYYEQQDISAISLPGDRVPWNDCDLPNHGDQTSRPEDQKDQAGSSPDPRPPPTLSPGGVPAARETECYQSSVADGTSLLSSPADLP